MKRLLLPDPEYFQSEKTEETPLIKFYDWVVRNSCTSADIFSKDGEITHLLANLKIDKVIIHEEYDKKLRKIVKKFLMKKFKMTARSADREIPMHFLDIGPSTKPIPGLERKSKFHVYLEDGYLLRGKE